MAFLFLWILVGTIVRFLNLAAKPPWTDEFATLVFSLGNNYQKVPLNQVISLKTLLQPLVPNPQATISQVSALIIGEDNHPPLYFVLTHLWLNLFPHGEYLNLWAARSIAAIFGIISIPLVYWLGQRYANKGVAQGAAVAMAISPYGVYLAQEARHYTLAILLVILSLACCLEGIKYLKQQQSIPPQLGLIWLGINLSGLAIHYFFALSLLGQGLSLLYLGIKEKWLKNFGILIFIALATISLFALWFYLAVPPNYGRGMTDWITKDNHNILTLISPPFQALATWITFISLLPVESQYLSIIITSGALMIAYFIWAIPLIYHSLREQSDQLFIRFLGLFILIIIAFIFLITYGLGIDLTRGARYSFMYFPGAIILFGTVLNFYRHQRFIPLIMVTMALMSCLSVVTNLGYQKYYRPDSLIPLIQENSTGKILIATSHKTLVQTGEMMGLAWQIQRYYSNLSPSFLLLHGDAKARSQVLAQAVADLKPVDLWLINPEDTLPPRDCPGERQNYHYVNGYSSYHFPCFREGEAYYFHPYQE